MGTNPLTGIFGNAAYLTANDAPLNRNCIQVNANTNQWHLATIGNVGNLQMIAGKRVTVRFLYKTTALVGEAKLYLDFVATSTTDVYIPIGIPTGTADWTEYCQEILIPADATLQSIRLAGAPNSGLVSIAAIRFTNILQYEEKLPIDPSFTPQGFGLRGMYVGTKFRDNVGAYSRLRTRWNANVVRYGLEHAEATDVPNITDITNLTQYDAWMTGKLTLLDAALVLARNNGIKLIVDYHTMPGGNNILPKSNLLVEYDGRYWERYIYWWKVIASRYAGNDAIHAFDLMNEPADSWLPRSHGPSEKTWWDCQVDAATEIRKIDPTRILIFETNDYASPYRLDGLAKFPLDNCYPSIHVYNPGEFTANDATTTYPGLVVGGRVVNKQWLRELLQPVRDYQLRYRYPSVFVGEFATNRWKTGTAQWLDDLTSLFNEWNWTWTYFGFCDPDQYGSQGWSAVDLDLDNRQDQDVLAVTPTDRAQVIYNAMAGNTNPYL